MATIIGNKPIKVIQGTTKDIRRKFNADVTETISSVHIVCDALHLNVELSLTGNGEFTYRLPANVTLQYKPMVTTYDMKVVYSDGSIGVQTGIPFVVIERQNPDEEA